ncbi:putative RNA-directed DNA polymerase from transposon BS [Lamellibrachia satsuma]|nr:putative RNA-directed DNA polymerase from transposon BS [Lamellibrachia satsuma]
MPAVIKHAVVSPLLKKSDLDPEILSNYRPISNLSFISKLLEKYVASQIRQYLDTNDLFDVFQSAYRPAHSCETALVRIQYGILHSLNNRNTVILVLLDLSAAFDTVDHRLLLVKLHEIGIRDNAHRWIQSYLSQRTQAVKVDNITSRSVGLCSGVPQGSVLGPLFFTICCLGFNHVFEHHQLRYHMYADDTQLYVEFPRDQPAHATTAIDRISRCTADVKSWMVSHNLLLNECKTEAVVISAAQNRKRVQPPVDLVIDVCGCSVTPKPFIRDIGFVFDDRYAVSASTNGGADKDVELRINKVRHAFRTLRPVRLSSQLSINTKIRIFNTNVKPVLLYGCETWKTTQSLNNKLQVFINSRLRYILKLTDDSSGAVVYISLPPARVIGTR